MAALVDLTDGAIRGRTDYAPDTRKFALLDWLWPHRVRCYVTAPHGTAARKHVPPHPDFTAADIAAWLDHGAPLRCIAIVILAESGYWAWTRYDGNLSYTK